MLDSYIQYVIRVLYKLILLYATTIIILLINLFAASSVEKSIGSEKYIDSL